ncbi:MAG: cysteine desulfurase [bacterium]|nr:cysteine desulfurase [bacterium]
MTVRTPVYLDHHATTPVDPRVLDLLARVQRQVFGNPSSANHAFGWSAARLVDRAREQVAALVGGTAREIVFTSGATEADNLALLGVAEAHADRGRHLVATNLEHEAVAGPLRILAERGWGVTSVAADRDGLVAPEDVAAALRPDTVLVSVIAAQNEIGTIQPLARIGRICKEAQVLFHTDAAQAAGRIPIDVAAWGADLLSLSAHKLYGPKGVGALWVRRRDPRVVLKPLLHGGGQERDLRPGTLNVPGIAAFGEACRLAAEELPADAQRLRELRDGLLARLQGELKGVHLNGACEPRLPGNLNVSFAGIRGGRLLGALTTLAVSAGSACASAKSGPSAVLKALGVPDDLAAASLRIGLGRGTTAAEVDYAAARIIAAVTKLRAEEA